MKKMLALTAIAVLAFGGIAMAQPIDPDPDGMGVYFDTDGIDFCMTIDPWTVGVDPGPGSIPAYLLLTNPSSVDDGFTTVKGFVARIDATTNSYIPAGAWTLTESAFNNNSHPEYVVGLGLVPISVTGQTVVLATNNFAWTGYEGSAALTITLDGVPGDLSYPEQIGYAPEVGFPYPVQSRHGHWGENAWINGACDPIANENMTWGSVKSLY